MTDVTIDCPKDLVGRVIGTRGETIKDLQSKTGCSIQIDQNFPDGVPRKITIKGPATKLEAARQMVLSVMDNGPSASMPSLPALPVGPTVVPPVVPGAAVAAVTAAAPAEVPIDQTFKNFVIASASSLECANC